MSHPPSSYFKIISNTSSKGKIYSFVSHTYLRYKSRGYFGTVYCGGGSEKRGWTFFLDDLGVDLFAGEYRGWIFLPSDFGGWTFFPGVSARNAYIYKYV